MVSSSYAVLYIVQIDLSHNEIGGYYDEDNNEMVYTPEGAKALADALRVNASITQACQIRKVMRCVMWGIL